MIRLPQKGELGQGAPFLVDKILDEMSILLIEDHEMFATGLRLIVGGKHEIKAVTNGNDGLAELLATRPRLVLLDYKLPDVDGITLLKVIRALPNPPPVLVISGEATKDMIAAARQAGASGFLHKSLPAENLMNAIERVQAGESLWQEILDLPDSERQHEFSGNIDWDDLLVRQLGITDRQFDVLQLMSNGLSNKSIARELDIAESTVKTHVKSLFKILDANNRMTCFSKARDIGLVREHENAVKQENETLENTRETPGHP